MRLLSYNIHKGIGGRDRLYRIERIIRVIEEENPDLMCLQEVDRNVRRSRHDDQPTRLAEAFHAEEHLYQLNVHVGSGGYGNLILSRWPLRLTHQVSLRLRRLKPRGRNWRSLRPRRGRSTWSTGTSDWPSTSDSGRPVTSWSTPVSTNWRTGRPSSLATLTTGATPWPTACSRTTGSSR